MCWKVEKYLVLFLNLIKINDYSLNGKSMRYFHENNVFKNI